jgi:hypothetical protein
MTITQGLNEPSALAFNSKQNLSRKMSRPRSRCCSLHRSRRSRAALFLVAASLSECGSGSIPTQANANITAARSITDLQIAALSRWSPSSRADAILVEPKHVILDLPGRKLVRVSGSDVRIYSDGCSGHVAKVTAKPKQSRTGEQAYEVRSIVTGKCKVFFAGENSSIRVLTVKVE